MFGPALEYLEGLFRPTWALIQTVALEFFQCGLWTPSRDRKFHETGNFRDESGPGPWGISLGHLPGSPEVAFPWLSDGPSWLWVEVWAAQQPSDPSVCVYPCLRDPLRHSGVVTSTGPFIFSTCVSSTIEGTQILFLPQRGSIEGHSDTPSA